jgi:hypothetical protein
VRRPGPRPISAALESAVGEVRPAGLLAAVQAAWPGVAGKALEASTAPVSERAGTVTIACESAVWAHELELLAADLVARLNEQLEATGEADRVDGLRFVVGSVPNRA